MKRLNLYMASLIGIISDVFAIASLFLLYEASHFREVPQLSISQWSALDFLLVAITTVSLWYQLFAALLVISIVLPLCFYSVSFVVNIRSSFFIWASIAASIGVLWCLIVDYVILVVDNHYGSTEFYTLGPGAVLLPFSLLVSVVCSVYRRNQFKKDVLKS